MSDDINDNINNETSIMLALDQLMDTMDTIGDAIDNLRASVADAQQTLIEKYNTEQAKNRAAGLLENSPLTTAQIDNDFFNASYEESDIVLLDTPTVLH